MPSNTRQQTSSTLVAEDLNGISNLVLCIGQGNNSDTFLLPLHPKLLNHVPQNAGQVVRNHLMGLVVSCALCGSPLRVESRLPQLPNELQVPEAHCPALGSTNQALPHSPGACHEYIETQEKQEHPAG